MEENNNKAWQHVLKARKTNRPKVKDYINHIFDDFIELHGDRLYRDDQAIIGGIALLNEHKVTVIGINKGDSLETNLQYNFGMPHPEGYRKALRLMKQAEKFNRPIITFIDTPGAYPGKEAEERGQGEAIARNLLEMIDLEVPVIAILIGEGGSGGALALAVANEVWVMENSIYSILSPEGFASILYKDASKAEEAAQIMKITSEDLLELKIVERIIDELDDINEHFEEITEYLNEALDEKITQISKLSKKKIASSRYERFRKYGKRN
ncbi:acetyl-CoA carboxylase carboxyltransferase subunit alpha [Mycoplasma sp. P36-A1]|uniref:acetyl-CoA carboxylase carboxyltransferase subunit alpha n=1 Tax=Mycoplasma sp. P36-A1 TaxID=3252900 RepID=UPI003C3065EC